MEFLENSGIGIHEALISLICTNWDSYQLGEKDVITVQNPKLCGSYGEWEFVDINLENKLVECYYYDDVEDSYKIGTTYTFQDLNIHTSYD